MPRVVVDVMLKPEILDPQGQAVAGALPRLGIEGVTSVRVGRRIELEFPQAPEMDTVRELADRLLANPVIEDYTVRYESGDVGDGTGGGAAFEPGVTRAGGPSSADSPGSPDSPTDADSAASADSPAGEGPGRPDAAPGGDQTSGAREAP